MNDYLDKWTITGTIERLPQLLNDYWKNPWKACHSKKNSLESNAGQSSQARPRDKAPIISRKLKAKRIYNWSVGWGTMDDYGQEGESP